MPITKIPHSGDIKTNVNTGSREQLINLEGHQCPGNTTVAQLLADGVFTGSSWQDTLDYGILSINIDTDQDSAIDGLDIQWSNDGISVNDHDYFTILANNPKTFTFGPAERYYRVVYTNGSGGTTTTFHLTSLLRKVYVKPSSHRINDNIVGEDDATLNKSVLTGLSDINNIFENIISYRGALQVDTALVHKVGISDHFSRPTGVSTTFDVAASSGDTLLNVASTVGFNVGDEVEIYDSSVVERSHFHIVAINAGVSITVNRPLDNDFEIGDNIAVVSISLTGSGTLASPISYKSQPPANERWQITRLLITMLDSTVMDDGTFGGLPVLTNGVVLRISNNGVVKTITHWTTNGDMKDDMYDVIYSAKAPAGQYGLSGRWTFTNAEFIADLDGSTGDYLEILVQDDLSGLDSFQIKAQGRLFGG